MLKTVGLELAELREKKGYQQLKEFAQKYGLAEIHYWRIENGQANLTLKSLTKILSIHKVSLDDFFASVMKDRTTV